MNKTRFTTTASILFGALTLFCVLSVLDNAIEHLQAGSSLSWARFVVLVAAAFGGLAFLVPKKSVPIMRKLAQATEPGFVKFCLTIVLSTVFPIATGAGLVPIIPLAVTSLLFFVAFVLPGYAFSNLDMPPYEGKSLGDYNAISPEWFKSRHIVIRVVLFASAI